MNRTAFFAGCLAVASTVPAYAQSPAPVTLRLTGTGADDVVSVLYAEKNGQFRAVGLDTVYERANSGAAGVAAVMSGSFDIGKSSMGSLIAARARNIDLKIVAGGAIYRATDQQGQVLLVVAADSLLRTAKDFNGKTLSVPALGDQNVLIARAWIDAHGGDSRTVQFVEVPSSAAAAAVTQGRVAGSVLVPPFAARAIADGKVRSVAAIFGAIAPRFLETAWFATADYVVKNRDAVLLFGKVVAQASAYVNAHQADVVDLIASFTGQAAAAVAQNGVSTLATSLEAREMQPLIDAMAKYAMIDRRFDAAAFIVK
ncbi:MAG: ABC transporter substrate-binding protein [Candidatus Lustribacter sp.]|jgi:NitT/TauT family transport system substrate-binding protein